MIPDFKVVDPGKQYLPCPCGANNYVFFPAGELFYKIDAKNMATFGIERPQQQALCLGCMKVRTQEDLLAEARVREATRQGGGDAREG